MPKLFLVLALCAASPVSAADPGAGVNSEESNRSLSQLKLEAKSDGLPSVDQPPAATVEQRCWVVVRAATPKERTAIAGAGMSIDEVESDRVAGIAHIRTIRKLQELGFSIVSQVGLTQWAKDFPPEDRAYHDYGRAREALESLARANPGLVSLFSIGKAWQSGHKIWCLRFNTTESGSRPSKKPGAVFVGGHHAREHLGVEVALKLAQYLAERRGDAAVRKLLESRDIYIIPMLNPDGADYDVSAGGYKWHRKNMRLNPDRELGVDLNRNYDFLFGGEGSSGDTYSETYRGPGAFSEPETKALKAFLEARPNVKMLNSYHSYGELILYPWGGKDGPIADARDRQAYQALAGAMAALTGYTAMQSADLYVATGDCADWAYAALKIFSFTTELYPQSGHGGFYPGAGAIAEAAAGNIKAALHLIEYADDPRRAAGHAPREPRLRQPLPAAKAARARTARSAERNTGTPCLRASST